MAAEDILKNKELEAFFSALETRLRGAGYDGGVSRPTPSYEEWAAYQTRLWGGHPGHAERNGWLSHKYHCDNYSNVLRDVSMQSPMHDVFVHTAAPIPLGSGFGFEGSKMTFYLAGDLRMCRYAMRVNEGDELEEDDRNGRVHYGNQLRIIFSAPENAKSAADINIILREGYGLYANGGSFESVRSSTLKRLWSREKDTFNHFAGADPAEEKETTYAWGDRHKAFAAIDEWLVRRSSPEVRAKLKPQAPQLEKPITLKKPLKFRPRKP